MLRLLAYLLQKGIATTRVIPEFLQENTIGLPRVTDEQCVDACNACVQECPTEAIIKSGTTIEVDRGACIGCTRCIETCQSNTLMNDSSVDTFTYSRKDLRIQTGGIQKNTPIQQSGTFGKSLAIRVVSTGCSACDLELIAANNPIFDMERFGIHVVASPRFADALLITGPVPKAMHEALISCYKAMAAPKIVIACGTCAISGGLHSNGYTEANGASALLPVDVFIPGCPPHPWQIIRGIQAAQKLKV